jgi:predicted chitinase
MAYQIVNGNIVAKATDGQTKKFSKQNVDIIIAECKSQGITNKYLIAGILATISKESAFKPQSENLNYSADGLKKIFPRYFLGGLANASEYAKKPEKIANYIYGNTIKNGKIVPGRVGNTLPGDGWKYRGRGFNQITFKGIYQDYVKLIPNLIENPDLLNNVPEAAKVTILYYVKNFKSSVIKSRYGKTAYDVNDWNEALLIVINVTAGLGNKPGDTVVKDNYNKAKLSHQFLIDYLEKNPEGTTVPDRKSVV